MEQEQILQHLIKVDLIAKFEQLPADDQRAIEAVQQKVSASSVTNLHTLQLQTFGEKGLIRLLVKLIPFRNGFVTFQ